MVKHREPDDLQAAEGGDWVQVGKAPKAGPTPAAGVLPVEPEDDKPYEAPDTRQPWKYSVYTAVAGLILMAAVYVLPEWRSFDTPWDDEFPTVYPLAIFPVLGLIWGIVGTVGKQYRANAGKAAIGVVLSIAALAVALSGQLQNPRTERPTPQTDERLQMTPQELQEWRSEKLRQ